MICLSCKSENNLNRMFCSHCGKILPVIRHSCGFINDSRDIFCGGCGVELKIKTTEEKGEVKYIKRPLIADAITREDIEEMLGEDDFKLKSKSYTLMQNEIDSIFKK